MIRHIVMFTAKTPDNIEPMYEGLKMLETIEGNWSLKVTKNTKVDQIANDIDVVVYAEFPDEAALATYKAHPTYENCIKIVRPLRDQRIAVDVPV
ncbi:MAG: Dabb family protein [Alphaproteobacteria bacterium]|nr:Dabb family protein [Alphaproteobacteria bacterium]